jgi:hypothetical protein
MTPVAVSVTVIVAVLMPAAEGVKVTVTMQGPAGTDPHPAVGVTEKSEALVPVTTGAPYVVLTVLVKVTGCGGLGTPTVWAVKVTPAGVTVGWAGTGSAGAVVANVLGAAASSRPELNRTRARMRAMNPVLAR